MKFGEVKELIAIFEKTDLNDMEVQLDNAVVRLNRGRAVPMPSVPVMPSMPVMPSVPPVQARGAGPEAVFMAGKPSADSTAPDSDVYLPDEEIYSFPDGLQTEKKEKDNNTSSGKFIKAPIVGTFYQSASPEKPPYVNVGDTVSKGDIVCIIEAMKFMNEVTSEENGKITEILVEDGQFVEFGEPLFRLG